MPDSTYSARIMLRPIDALSLFLLLLGTQGLAATRAEGQPAEPMAVDAARCTFAAPFAGAPLIAGAFARDGSVMAMYSATGLAVVRSEDCVVLAQTTHTIEETMPVVLVTDARRVVVVARDGVWVWDTSGPTVRHVLSESTDLVAVHAGGESIVLAVATSRDATLYRLDVRTGRVTRRRTLTTGELRGVESLGWDPRDGSLLVLTEEGNLFSMSPTTLGRPSLLRSYVSGIESRRAVLEAGGELVYEALRELRPDFAVVAVSADGRRALLESFPHFSPSPAPRRWMTWSTGSALPATVSGPTAGPDEGGSQRAFAISSTGRTLLCFQTWSAPPVGLPPVDQACWVVDL